MVRMGQGNMRAALIYQHGGPGTTVVNGWITRGALTWDDDSWSG